MSAANRRRGHDTERKVAQYLRSVGFPDACTTRQKLGHDGATAPGDIDWHPLVCLEVKDRKESSWPSWCRQATAEAREGMVPVVVRRTRGVVDVGVWECRVEVGGLLELVDVYGTTSEFVHDVGDDEWVSMPFAQFVELVRQVDAPVAASAAGEGEA